MLERKSAQWKAWPTRETEVIEAYEALLLSNGFIDFDGLVLAGMELVEKHEWVRSCIKAKYPVMVIDEYQDLGLPLHRMILSLMNHAGVRIIAVGDPDQSIYGFTGAKPSLLKDLAKLPRVEAIRLKLNYRCADQIIAASKTLLASSSDSKSHDGRKGEILVYKLKVDVKGQAEFALTNVVPSLLRQNPTWRPGDIAMLYRSLNQGNPIAEAADALAVSYFRLDNGSPIKRSRLTEWLTDCAKWCSGGWQSGTISLGQVLNSWRRMRRSPVREVDFHAERTRLVSTLFANRDGSIPLCTWLAALKAALIDEAFEKEPGLADEKDYLKDLLAAAGKGGALQSYSIEAFGNQGRSPDQINLMTLHSSKGLEFQAVIMVGLEAGAFPSNLDSTKEKEEEATRGGVRDSV